MDIEKTCKKLSWRTWMGIGMVIGYLVTIIAMIIATARIAGC